MTELNRNHSKEFKKSTVLAVALFIAAPIVYLFLAYVLKIEVKGGGEMDMLYYILFIVAMVQPTVAPLVERFHLNRYRTGGASRMSAGQLFTSISLIKFALVESIYIYGLVVYVITGDMMRMLSFYAVGAIWSMVYWPRQSAWKKFSRTIDVK